MVSIFKQLTLTLHIAHINNLYVSHKNDKADVNYYFVFEK
jgi:hypothetical protein